MSFNDLTNKRYGRWTAMEKAANRGKQTMWLCKCDCGTIREVNAYSLTHNGTYSCGCFAKEHPNRKKHGLSYSATHRIWANMKDRCYNPHNKAYSDYGGRGIIVCERWKNNFEAFYEDVSKLPHFDEKGYSLDRIDNEKNYEPSNVRWATSAEQNQNKRNNINITYNGKTQCLKAWAKELDMPYCTLWQRIKTLKWSAERAFTTPL